MKTAANHPSSKLIFAPVGIAHLTGSNADLVRAAAAGRSRLRVTTAAQLNGVPHLGTVVTMLAVFALTAHCADELALSAGIVFDALDNAPAERREIDGQVYTRTVGDLIETGDLERTERIGGFQTLLNWAQHVSGVDYEFRPYDVYQGLRPVRECLLQIASRQDDFAPFVAPRDGIIKVRPRCPQCRLMQKSGRDLTMTALSGAVRLESLCPDHGAYAETIHLDGGGWYDANTPVRSVQKGALLAAERDLYDAASVSIDGADWGGAWYGAVLAPALAELGIRPRDWPVSLFTPLIIDSTGGKLSKSLYVKHGAYADLPSLFLDLNVLLAGHGEQVLEAIWTEVTQWAREPRRLHRSYSVDYFNAILPIAQPAGHRQSA